MKNDKQLNRATIESLSHEGRGVARIDNKAVFIQNALPGEEVDFVYTKKQNKFATGIAVEILKTSPDRTKPFCKHYEICGGCSLQHLRHNEQIAFKTKTVLEQLKHIGGIEVKNILPSVIGPTEGYRSKARLSVKYVQKKQKLLIGFHEKNGRFVVETEECPILHQSVGTKILPLAELISQLSIYQQIPQVEVACGDNISALVLRNLKPFSDSDIEKLKNFEDKYNIKLYSQSGGAETVKPIFFEGNLSYVLTGSGRKPGLTPCEISFNPTDFTQINRVINQELANYVLESLNPQPEEKILDLFCGIGNFTLPIAKMCSSVIGVEGSSSAIARAKLNAEQNKIKNAKFYCADLTKELDSYPWSNEQFDKILLDPPRTGAQELGSGRLFGLTPIIYISCSPATFARDAKILTERGYTLENIRLFDMYPHTRHIELVASFRAY